MRSSNPALVTNPFSGGFGLVSESHAMTIRGTVNKTAILLLLVVLPAAWVWRQFYLAGQNPASVQTWMLVGLFGGFILSLATIFKKSGPPLHSTPLCGHARAISWRGFGIFEKSYPGIVMQAVSLSIATLLVMLVAYQIGLGNCSTERFKWGVIAATGAIALVYFASIILGMFHINVSIINGSGIFSILFSVFVC